MLTSLQSANQPSNILGPNHPLWYPGDAGYLRAECCGPSKDRGCPVGARVVGPCAHGVTALFAGCDLPQFPVLQYLRPSLATFILQYLRPSFQHSYYNIFGLHWQHLLYNIFGLHWQHLLYNVFGLHWQHSLYNIFGLHWQHSLYNIFGLHWQHLSYIISSPYWLPWMRHHCL